MNAPSNPSRPFLLSLSPRWTLFIMLALAGALYHVFIFRSGIRVAGQMYYCLFDDAMISMRYARHFSEGLGFVWNPGELPIEGFTNLLWTLMMSAVHLLPIHDAHTSLVVMLLGALILLANGVVVWRLAGAVSGDAPFVKIAATALTLFSYPLMFWTLRGMEVGLLALLVTVMAWQTIRLQNRQDQVRDAAQSLIAIAVCMALALLTRPDAIVPVIVIAVFAAAAQPAGSVRWRTALMLAAVILCVTGALTLWRHLYFGDPLPNTYYLKMTGFSAMSRIARGAAVLGHLLALHFWLPVAIAIILLIRRGMQRAELAAPLLLSALSFAMLAYSVYVGGDAWEDFNFANRYIAVALPALFVLSAMGLDGIAETLSRRICGAKPPVVAWALLVLFLVTQNAVPFADWIRGGAPQQVEHEANTRQGLLLRAGTSQDAVVAVTWAGAIPYFSQRSAIDMLGKNDRVIARMPAVDQHLVPGHMKWNYEHSLGTGRASVILELFHSTAVDYRRLAAAGYRVLPSGLMIRQGDPGIDAATLSTDAYDSAGVDAALAAAPYQWR